MGLMKATSLLGLENPNWGKMIQFNSCICFLVVTYPFYRGWLKGLPNNSYKPITNTAWVRARLCKLQKGYFRLAAASDKVYQLFAHCPWFSPGTPASSTIKTGRHDIAEILLKVALNTIDQIKSINFILGEMVFFYNHFLLLFCARG